jgi:cytochrome c-type biogenesis protein CcmE
MAQATWEKPQSPAVTAAHSRSGRWKFMIGGILILAAVAYLIISGTATGARYYMTLDELKANPDYVGKSVRMAGAVVGDSIHYDEKTLTLDFTIANVPMEYDNLADALHKAVTNPQADRIQVHVEGQAKPDLLQNEAQAILTGQLNSDGIFYATELNLKCPTRFQEAQPGHEIVQPSA